MEKIGKVTEIAFMGPIHKQCSGHIFYHKSSKIYLSLAHPHNIHSNYTSMNKSKWDCKIILLKTYLRMQEIKISLLEFRWQLTPTFLCLKFLCLLKSRVISWDWAAHVGPTCTPVLSPLKAHAQQCPVCPANSQVGPSWACWLGAGDFVIMLSLYSQPHLHKCKLPIGALWT